MRAVRDFYLCTNQTSLGPKLHWQIFSVRRWHLPVFMGLTCNCRLFRHSLAHNNLPGNFNRLRATRGLSCQHCCACLCVCVYYDMYFWRLTHRMATTDWSEELRFLISLLNWCHCIFFPCFCCYCSFRHPLPDKLSLAMMEYRYGIFVVIAG